MVGSMKIIFVVSWVRTNVCCELGVVDTKSPIPLNPETHKPLSNKHIHPKPLNPKPKNEPLHQYRYRWRPFCRA